MKMRLIHLQLTCKRSVETILFDDLTYFYGEMGAGKSTIARLIDYCFGSKQLVMTPALQSEFVSVSLDLIVGEGALRIERERESNQALVAWEDHQLVIPVRVPNGAVIPDTEVEVFSDLVFHLIGQNPPRVRKSQLNEDSELERLSLRDLLWYCYLDQDSMDSRYALLTGRYCWRTRLKHWVLFGVQCDPLIDWDRVTLPEFLQAAGYRTGMVGKWHLGLKYRRSDNSVADGWDDEGAKLAEAAWWQVGMVKVVSLPHQANLHDPLLQAVPRASLAVRAGIARAERFVGHDHSLAARVGRGGNLPVSLRPPAIRHSPGRRRSSNAARTSATTRRTPIPSLTTEGSSSSPATPRRTRRERRAPIASATSGSIPMAR